MAGEAHNEGWHQRMVIKWTQQESIRRKWPELKLLYHVPNERRCTQQQGRLLKLEGVKSGVPDLALPVPKGQYHGLYIEMKTLTGHTRPEQEWWLAELNYQGYYCKVCHGWESAVRALEWYMQLQGGDL